MSGSEQSAVTTSATPGTGWAAAGGSEQSVTAPSTASTGWVTINGSEQSTTVLDPNDPCDPVCGAYITVYDIGTVTITVNGISESVNYGRSSTASGLAATLASNFNADPASPVTAGLSGSTIYFTSKAVGAAVNYSLSSSSTFDNTNFSDPSFAGTPSGSTLTGGSDITTFDTGSAWVTVNGIPYQTSYGQSDTAATVAQRLQAALGPSVVNASLSGSTITLTAKTSGGNTNYSLAAGSSTSQPATFSHPSFTISVSGPALTGGHDAGLTYDTGSVWVSVNGATYPATYGQSDTLATMVTKLQSALASSPVTASPSGSTILLTAKQNGANTNYALSSGSSTSQPSLFLHPSFTVTASGSALTGGSDPTQPSLDTPQVTLYSYDALGNLQCVEQHGNVLSSGCSASPSQDATSLWRVRRYTYDSLSRLLTASNPESGTINYTYDHNNNLIQKVSPAPNQTGSAAVTTSYGYDPLNRLSAKSYSSGGGVVYLYDQSNLWGIQIKNGVGGLSAEYNYAATGNGDSVGFLNSYDVMGRTAYQFEFNQRNGQPSQVNKSFNYVYNPDGSLKSITYPSGRIVAYSYNAAQRPLSAVDNNSINFATNAHYTAAGAVSKVVNGNNITTTNFYNTRMQPVFLSASAPSQTVLSFGYDFTSCNANGGDNGDICGITNNKDGTRSESFVYDPLNRLLSATSGNWNQSYTYDIWGNLLKKNISGGDTSLDVNVNPANQETTWCYDAAGNVVGPGMCSTYSNNIYPNKYDGENRLTNTAAGIVYDYDADGRRVSKSNGTLYWYGPGGQVLEETDLNGNLKNEYMFFNGKRIARYSTIYGYSYYFSDHLGSATVVTDANGTIKEESDYYPFGGERVVLDLGIGNNYKFTSKERDLETGCDYFGARYYCNSIGRWLTPDGKASSSKLFNPQTWNRYTYVLNDPVNKFDPDGFEEHHFWATLVSAVSLKIGFGFGYGFAGHLGPVHVDVHATFMAVGKIGTDGKSTIDLVLSSKFAAGAPKLGVGADTSLKSPMVDKGGYIPFKDREIQPEIKPIIMTGGKTNGGEPYHTDATSGKELEFSGLYAEGGAVTGGIVIDTEKTQEAFKGLFEDAEEGLLNSNISQDAKEMFYYINTPKDQLGNQPVNDSDPCQGLGEQTCDKATGYDNDHLDSPR